MTTDRFEMFHNRLLKLSRHLSKQARKKEVTCYRLYDHDLPEFPFCIDRYEDKVYVAEYRRRHGMDDEVHTLWLQQCVQQIAASLQVAPHCIFTKLRQRKPGRSGQYQRAEEQAGDFFVVKENGLSFWVNLTDYLDTGLFLDHRDTRALVRLQSGGKRVLNLFAYTGSFSVYAAAGGAARVTTVDLSSTYLQWARRNMALNHFGEADDAAARYTFIRADVKEYLQQAADHSADLIIMDPPTFSNSKRMDDILDIQRDHPQLIQEALRVLTPEGTLYFSTNFTKFAMDSSINKMAQVKDITRATTPFDFAGRTVRFCFQIRKSE